MLVAYLYTYIHTITLYITSSNLLKYCFTVSSVSSVSLTVSSSLLPIQLAFTLAGAEYFGPERRTTAEPLPLHESQFFPLVPASESSPGRRSSSFCTRGTG